MPRIHTITTDTVLSDNDMLLGTDGAVGANNATKNFSFGVFKNYITSNVTFTGDTIISGGNLTLDNNKFLMSKMANGTAASLIGISSNNQIKLSNSNLPIYTGTGLVSLGGNLELPNGNIIANGTLAASGYNDSNWNTAYSWGNHATAGYLPLTGGIITGNMTNRGEQSFGVDGDGELFKIYTNTSGKLLSFNPAANGKLNLTDNTMATFGNSDDLQIYHNGTANYIDSNGGQMFLRASVSDGKMYFMGDDGNGGYTEYFYIDGSTAVYDSNQGQAVSVETRFPPDAKATFGITGSMQTSLWNSNAGDFFMSETGGGNMNFHTDGAHIAFGKRGAGATHTAPLTDAETMAKFIIDGGVELYYDNDKKFQTTSAGVKTLGRIDINGAYVLPTVDGTNGQVLKTNGAGTLAFANDIGALLGIQEGGEFTNSLIVGHTGTGTLDAAQGNTGVGVGAMNTVTSGDHNAALGHDALGAITIGSSNIAIGKQALFTSVVDNNNVAIGKDALYSLTNSNTSSPVSGQAENNIAIGWQAGNGITTGSNNIVIGYNADASSATVNNEITIGNTDTTHAIIKGLKKEVSNITSNAQASRNNIHVFSASSNLTITLPDTGTDSSVIGMSFTFVTKTAPASGNVHKIVCSDTTNESIFGSMLATKASSAGSDFMQTDDAAIADGRSSINFNGTTQGGRQGTHITLTCIAADTWLVEGTMRYTGTFASSFANS